MIAREVMPNLVRNPDNTTARMTELAIYYWKQTVVFKT